MKRQNPPSGLERAAENIEALPAWARPPFYGMFIVYGMIAAKAGIALPILLIIVIASGPSSILTTVWLLIAAGLAGFAGGVAFSLVRPILKRLGRVGAIATGWICVFTYLIVILSLIEGTDADTRRRFDLHDPVAWVIAAVLSLLFGSVMGLAFMDDDANAKRRRLPWMQRPQQVTSRVHPPAP